MKKALVAIDNSRVSREVVSFAYALKMGLDNLDFIHVMEYRDQSVPGSVEYFIVPDPERVKKDLVEMIRARSEESGNPRLPHILIIRTGNPSEEIVEKAENDDYEVIIIGHRGMSDIGRFFIGSVAAKVVRHAPCDVLIHKPENIKQA